jgi:hypothetical protein
MKKMLVGMVTMVVVLSALSASAYAGTPTPADGSFAYAVTSFSDRWADGNWFIYATDTAIWKGTFEGTSREEYVAVLHGSGVGFYKGTVSFAGTVEGREGTVEISFVGSQPATSAPYDPSQPWEGTWRIISGGGELANLHGQGTFTNPEPFNIDYSGRIHFDPKGE